MSRRTGIMLCYPLELKRLKSWLAQDGYVICQPKFDGDRGRALLHRDQVELLSSEAEPRNFALPHIVAELERLKPMFHSLGIYELDGEFYSHQLPHEKIHGICARTTNIHPEHNLIGYYIFDHINSTSIQINRLKDIYSFVDPYGAYVVACGSTSATSVDDVMSKYQECIDIGYEGIILRRPFELYHRKRFTGIMKYKPKRTDTYDIIGYKEELTIHGEAKDTLGALELVDPEGTHFWVSAGLTHAQRKHYWEERDQLIGCKCTIHYQAVTDRGVPKFVTDLEIN